MTRFIFFVCIAILIGFNYGNYFSWHWFSKWTVLTGLFSLFFSAWAGRRLGYVFSPIIFLCLSSAAEIFAWNFNEYQPWVSPMMFVTLAKTASYGFVSVVMAVFALATLPKHITRAVRESFVIIATIGSLATIFHITSSVNERGSFSGNPSMHGGLLACLIPFAWLIKNIKWRLAFIGAVVAAILLVQASIPLGVLSVTAISLLLAKYGINKKQIYISLGGLLFLGMVGDSMMPDSFLNSSGRWQNWIHIMKWWWDNSNHWLGTGFGTSLVLLPYAQTQMNWVNGDFYLWMHNDWLQILFELGFVGLLFTLMAWFTLARKSFRSPHLFASFMGFSALACFNYPLRLPIHVTCLTLLCWLILNQKGESHGKSNEIC